MMKKRTFAFALACALSLALLTSCGGKKTADTNDVTPPVQSETQVPDQTEREDSEQPVQENEPQTPEVDEETGAQSAGNLKLSHADVTLKTQGSRFTLTADLKGEKLYYGSKDEAVATVDEKGVVTAVAPGTTSILVETEDGRSASCVVRCNWTVTESEQPEQKPAEKPEQKPEEPAKTSVDLGAFYTEIASSSADFPAMMPLEKEYLDNFYPGLSDISLSQSVIYGPMISAVACEVAMVECANSADVETVKAIFQSRIDAQVAGGAWYPATIAVWENNAKIVTEGNYVGLFVIPDGMMDAASEFSKLF